MSDLNDKMKELELAMRDLKRKARYLRARKPVQEFPYKEVYGRARREHAWLLRAEGLTLAAIAARVGLETREGARALIGRFARSEIARATRKTRFTITTGIPWHYV